MPHSNKKPPHNAGKIVTVARSCECYMGWHNSIQHTMHVPLPNTYTQTNHNTQVFMIYTDRSLPSFLLSYFTTLTRRTGSMLEAEFWSLSLFFFQSQWPFAAFISFVLDYFLIREDFFLLFGQQKKNALRFAFQWYWIVWFMRGCFYSIYLVLLKIRRWVAAYFLFKVLRKK